MQKGDAVVDLGTSSVSQTRDFAGQLQAKGAVWADAPIARTRQAAQDGTLSVMVGASAELFAKLEPVMPGFANRRSPSVAAPTRRSSSLGMTVTVAN